MMRRLNRIALALLMLIGAPYYWYLLDNRPGDAAPKPVTITQLRALAAAMPGPAPNAVEVQLVGWRRVPGNLFAAGSGLKRRLIGIMAWRLPVPGGRPVLIDTGLTEADSRMMGMDAWRPESQAVVERAMDEAGLILVTHEHPDHEGALAAHGGAALMQAAALNRNQLRPAKLAARLSWKGAAAPTARIAGTAPQAVVPGVVAIPAPSHTPGSQMIFVRLANGREYLFAGDIATMDQSWRELRARSRLIGTFLAPENRAEVFAWLKTVQALKGQAPGLIVLPGHDYEAVFDRDRPSGVKNGFGLSQIKVAAAPKN